MSTRERLAPYAWHLSIPEGGNVVAIRIDLGIEEEDTELTALQAY